MFPYVRQPEKQIGPSHEFIVLTQEPTPEMFAEKKLRIVAVENFSFFEQG